MKNKNSRKTIISISLLLIAILSILPNIVLAQGAPPATPIDGGLSLLLAVGGIYGLKKIGDTKNNK